MSEVSRFSRLDRAEDRPVADREALFSPEFIAERFFRPGGPVERLKARFAAAGISAEVCEVYGEAVREFFDRPTELGSTGAFSEERGSANAIQFRPSHPYFQPKIFFPEGDARVQDILGGTEGASEDTWRPHQTREAQIRLRDITGADAFARLARPPTAGEGRSSVERLLAQINRLQYALHEGVHVLEGGATGDLLNLVLAEIGGKDIVSHTQARNFFRFDESLHKGVGQKNPAPENEISVLGLPIASERDVRIFLAQEHEGDVDLGKSEMSIDYFSQAALQGEFLEHPALVWWCHNTLSIAVTALRELRSRSAQVPVPRILTQYRLMLARVVQLTTLIGPLYFSAFTTSEHGRTFLLTNEKKTVLGRHLSGDLARTPPFSRLEIENLLGDVDVRLNARTSSKYAYRGYYYPVSKQSLLMKEKEPALTDAGVRIATDIIAHAHEASLTAGDVQALFKDIETLLEKGSEGTSKGRSRVCRALEEGLGIHISDEELRELYGVGSHLETYLSREYQKRFALRAALIRKIEEVSPGDADFLIRDLFQGIDPTTPAMAVLVGFRDVGGAASQSTARNWREIARQKELGIFGIDMTRLRDDQRGILESWFRFYQTGKMQVSEFKDCLRECAQWKREQLASAR